MARSSLFLAHTLLLLALVAHVRAQSCAVNRAADRDVTALFIDPVLGQDPDTGAPVFSISLALNPSLTFDLGGASLFFRYDDDALDFREVVFSDFVTGHACYSPLDRNDDRTDDGQTAIGLIINPFTCDPTGGADGATLTAGEAPVVLATITYTVVDPSRQAVFVFTNTVSNDDAGQSCRTIGEPFFPLALPVELTAFEALADGRDALLTWTTASETNNAGFFVEQRTRADAPWHEVGFVAGGGTRADVHHYRYRVAELGAGRHTFRLRQIDFDGAATLSAEVSVEIATPETVALRVWPNPTRGATHLSFALPRAGRADIALFDLLGREVRRLIHGDLAAGWHDVPFAADTLAPGVYVLRYVTEHTTATRPVVVAR